MKIDSKNLVSTFWHFVLPTTGALLVSGLYQVVDGIFIGNNIGKNGLTAINMGWPLVTLVFGLGLMVGVGAGASSSIEQGRKNRDAATRYIAQYFWLILFLTIPSSLIIYFAGAPMLRLQKADPVIFQMGMEYINIMVYGSSVILLSISAPMIVRNIGSPFFATFSVICGAVTNIVLDYFFIVRFGWELKGAATATVIGEGVTAILCVAYILSSKNNLRPSLNQFKFQLKLSLEVLKLGISSMLSYVYVSVIIVLYNIMIMEYGGVLYVAAYSIIGYVIGIFYMLSGGISSGIQPLISYFFGARDFKNMYKTLVMAFKLGMVIGGLFFFLCVCITGVPVSIFTEDPELYRIAVRAMRISLMMIIFEGIIVIMSTFFQSIGSASKAVFISISNMAIKVPVLLIFACKWGISGVWFSLPTCDVLLFSIVVFLFFLETKKIKKIKVPQHG